MRIGEILNENILYNGPNGKLIEFYSGSEYKEFKKYANGANWTVVEGPNGKNYFDHYLSQGPIYLWVDKTSVFFLHFETNTFLSEITEDENLDYLQLMKLLKIISKTPKGEHIIRMNIEELREYCINNIESSLHGLSAFSHTPSFLMTEKLCLMAVNQEGNLLEYVPEKLKTFRVCLEAVTSNTGGTEASLSLPENLKRSPEFLKLAIEGNPYLMSEIGNEFVLSKPDLAKMKPFVINFLNDYGDEYVDDYDMERIKKIFSIKE